MWAPECAYVVAQMCLCGGPDASMLGPGCPYVGARCPYWQLLCFHCFDTVIWPIGVASSLQKSRLTFVRQRELG